MKFDIKQIVGGDEDEIRLKIIEAIKEDLINDMDTYGIVLKDQPTTAALIAYLIILDHLEYRGFKGDVAKSAATILKALANVAENAFKD